MKPIRTTATRMFVAPNLFKLCVTALLVFYSFIFSTTSAIAAPNAHATALQNAANDEQGQKQQLEGELEVIYEDYEDHSKSLLRYMLKTKNGRVELHFPENSKANALQSGTKVRVSGWLFKHGEQAIDSLALTDDPNALTVLALDGSATTTSTTTPAVLADTFGEQRTLVLMLNFQDNSSEQPWTVEQVEEMLFTTVSDYYREVSYGQTWLSGDVHGYLTLPIDATCDFAIMDDYAQQAASDSGIDVGSYQRLVYLFPNNSACGWRGQGTVGGTPSKSWINGELNLLTIGHEMGHNLGLHHAKYIGCNDSAISASCISLEYGDNLDIMGKSTGHFNAFNKERLGWLSAATGEIITVDSNGSYFIEPYELISGGAAKGIKVRRGTDAATGQALWYYLEYRQALGFDSFLNGMSGITEGVLVHLNISSDIDSSQLLDMTPNSSIHDLDDAALVVGSSYSDADAGVSITTEWADATGVSVYVSFSEQACVQNNPAITLLADESGGVVAGSTVNYSATVTNNDSRGCSASDFDVSANVPAGWETTDSTLNLAAGESGTVTVNVTSPDTAVEKAYAISIRAENSVDSSYQSSAVSSYLLETPVETCVLASPILTLATDQGGAVAPGTTITYSATLISQDSSSCDPAVVDLAANVPAGWSAGSTSVSLAAGDSASVNISVTSANTAADGVYILDVNAFNAADVSYSSSVMGSYTVAAPAAVCLAAIPLLSLSANIDSAVIAGSTVSYSATLTNQDSSDCAASNFAVFADVPAGWSADNTNVNLAAGESATVKISATSATTASDGTYSLILHAQNTVDSRYSGSLILSYLLATPQAPLNSVPIAVNDNVILSAKNALLIDVLANDWDPDGDSLTIRAVSQGAKGSVEIRADGGLFYTPEKSFKGRDSFSYTISDGDKTATTMVEVSLERVK